ncbi:ABC transporter permease [Halopiger xanaduensis]|uniref:ABC-type transporter, integral membrane subunit n=1 Tax=Halopiger xanaduensis (strain DSM 18323 / JCM 14033 / SH-6) TaxID=797210 RepID=F8D3M1_HALXS|nr:ABC transporter permease [Halopiger xanaduensis]AEH37386.1 ABC-type transporter, integral membrane subunit [Halopiger xanaduensis SH-6]
MSKPTGTPTDANDADADEPTLPFSRRTTVGLIGAGAVLAVWIVVGLLAPDSWAGVLLSIAASPSTHTAMLRLAVPIALAAIGGIFAEKSGVINIGIEGLLIVSAFSSIVAVHWLGVGEATAGLSNHWWGLLVGTIISVLFALIFAIVCIEFKADQIIAGLAVWLISLGLAPFASQIVFGSPNTASVGRFSSVTIPVLSDVPFLGYLLFDTEPQVYIMLAGAAVGWYLLARTNFGRWVVASGENPKALDTAGVDVRKVRYAAVLLSGVFAGLGGAGFALGDLGTFAGGGDTAINGRGFIAIATYLLANYHPIGALLGSFLFAGLDSIQTGMQAAGYAIPTELIRVIPHMTVIVVLVLVGRTRLPDAAGDHYESGED